MCKKAFIIKATNKQIFESLKKAAYKKHLKKQKATILK